MMTPKQFQAIKDRLEERSEYDIDDACDTDDLIRWFKSLCRQSKADGDDIIALLAEVERLEEILEELDYRPDF